MKKKSSVASPSSTKKPNLRSSTGPGSIHFSAKTPEKPPQRTHNRGVALSVSEIKRVGKELQDRKQQCSETTSSQTKSSVRRQISLWPSSSGEPKVTGDEPKLPQKYEILGEFFHHLDSLILIFRLKRWTPSFKKISSRIESLADRRFTMGHLAQLKFVLPEAIILKKILVHDERTSCMEADINISIDPKAVGSDERVPLRKLFWTRLRDFWESHPEGDEIPEEALPEPFNRPKEDSLLDKLKTSLPTKMSSCMPYNVIVNKAESADNDDNVSVPVETSVETSPAKLPSEAASTESCPTICASQESSGVSSATPSKDKSLKSIDVFGTPVKLVSTPIRLMSATPALRPSKRPYMSPDDNTTSSLNKLARRPPSSRSLKFNTPVKHKEVVSEHNAGDLPFDDDVFDILPENLIQSIREKERMTMEERDPAISQARRHAKNITRLPNLFDMIRILLRQRSCITKSELVSKIISGHCDITDRSEVEEQLSLLLELAPEWISEKLASSGDLLVMINKIASPKTIRASLEAAKSSISGNTHCPLDHIIAPSSSPQDSQLLSNMGSDEDFVVIELGGEPGAVLPQVQQERNESRRSLTNSRNHSTRKVEHLKPRKCHHVSIMGDECIDIRKKDDQFSIQPIRRSFSMDSAHDRQIYLDAQAIIQQNRHQNVASASEDCNSRGRRAFFPFCYGKGSKNAILPLENDV